jgi:hypothetical protein
MSRQYRLIFGQSGRLCVKISEIMSLTGAEAIRNWRVRQFQPPQDLKMFVDSILRPFVIFHSIKK